MAGSKKRAKRRKKSASKLPFVLLVGVMGGVGALLVVSAQNSISGDSPSTSSVANPADNPADSTTPADSNDPTPVATIGSVAPPVTIDVGDDDDHNDEVFVLDDYTPTDAPEVPSSTRTVPASAVDGERVTGDLADGYYIGYLASITSASTLDLHLDSASGPLTTASVDDLIFVSLRVDARDPAHPGNAVVGADTLVRLIESGQSAVAVPESDDFVVIGTKYLVTVSGGVVIGLEGLA